MQLQLEHIVIVQVVSGFLGYVVIDIFFERQNKIELIWLRPKKAKAH